MNSEIYKMAFKALGEFATSMVTRKELDISMLDESMTYCRTKWQGEKDAYASVAELYKNLKETLGI